MPCQINNTSNFDISEIEELIQDLFSFSQKRHGFKKNAVLNLQSDSNNTSPLGKTAHYDPSCMEITIYVDGRHPKDIMRSFSHELIHHNQNENGMFDKINNTGAGYAQSDPHLRKMEKEAYLKGNMCFRDWEDGYKSSNPNILNERRIYKMSTKKWLNKELNGLLNERWGFSMNLNKLNENVGCEKNENIYQESDDLDIPDEPSVGGNPDFLGMQKKDTEMGSNPEGVTELMDAINGLSEKESEEIYKMLLAKHGQGDVGIPDEPSVGGNPDFLGMQERKLREAVRKIIKSKLKKRK
jgi:hypothetical protein